MRPIVTALLSVFFVLPATDSIAQYKNVLVDGYTAPEETSICINPKNPAQIMAGANVVNAYRSNDTGNTWQRISLHSSYGVWGDPVIDVDTQGTFYYFHLSNPGEEFPTRSSGWVDRI